MYRSFFCAVFILIIIACNGYADTYTFNEYFDDDQTVFTDHGWITGMFNYTSPGWSYSYDLNGHNFAVTDLYYGSSNPRADIPNNAQVNFLTNLSYYIDGTFSMTYQFSWDGSQNTDGFTHHIYLRTSSGHTFGGGVTDMWHWDKGSIYLYANNGNPSDTVQYYSGNGTLNGFSGTGTVTISRDESDLISIIVSAGGTSYSASLVDSGEIKSIFMSYASYRPDYYGMTFPTLYSDSITLQGESSYFNQPQVPEPVSILLVGISSGMLLLRRIKRRS
ncbi:MAG: PEP-CTERM sorting domain-containing protein [Candidatus Auribacterota bacterium]